MTSALLAALAVATFVGHFSLAVWLFNRLHAKPWPRPLIDVLEKTLLLAAAAILAAYAWRYWQQPERMAEWPIVAGQWPWQAYALFCRIVCLLAVPLWLVPKLLARDPAALLAQRSKSVDLAAQLGRAPVCSAKAAIAAKIPGNEIFRLSVTEKTLAVARLPEQLTSLTIAHLSDLHMAGKLSRDFYEMVVDQTNDLQPDLIAVTGDIAEVEACIGWVEPIFRRLRPRLGAYFVLGNHEKRLRDVQPLRQALERAGLVDLGGRCARLSTGNTGILLAGTETPWFGSRPDVAGFAADGGHGDLRLLLSHTPDEYAWAKANQFDVMLAGHNHGGQIRLPYLGALIAPSRYGFRYAGGLYHEEPTLLHVSRGIGGLHSVRFNCPPELALLKLVRPIVAEEPEAEGVALLRPAVTQT
jgi:predicted MPP superfamily phosphohydrolase